MFDAPKALFLDRGHQPSILDEHGRDVAMVGVDPQNVHECLLIVGLGLSDEGEGRANNMKTNALDVF